MDIFAAVPILQLIAVMGLVHLLDNLNNETTSVCRIAGRNATFEFNGVVLSQHIWRCAIKFSTCCAARVCTTLAWLNSSSRKLIPHTKFGVKSLPLINLDLHIECTVVVFCELCEIGSGNGVSIAEFTVVEPFFSTQRFTPLPRPKSAGILLICSTIGFIGDSPQWPLPLLWGHARQSSRVLRLHL